MPVKELHLMTLRMLKFAYVAALLLFGWAATPAAAGGCGYNECEAAAPVVVQPYVYQSCSCCSCGGSSYYYAYAPANTYPAYGYGAAAYGYAAEYAPRA